MPLPNPRVVSAIFESYLNVRESDWKVKYDKTFDMPTDKVAAHKLKSTIEILQKINSAENFQAWINVLYDLAEKEQVETAEQTSNKLFPFGKLYTYIFDKRPHLLAAIRAAITYINYQISHLVEFSTTKNRLLTQQTTVEKSIKDLQALKMSQESIQEKEEELKQIHIKLNVLEDTGTFYKDHFKQFTFIEDPKPKENDFTDFEINVENKSRKLTNCTCLLEYAKKHPELFPQQIAKPISQKVEPQKKSTAPPAKDVASKTAVPVNIINTKPPASFATTVPKVTAAPQFSPLLFSNFSTKPLEEDASRLRNGTKYKPS